MTKKENAFTNTRYAIATRDVDLTSLIISGALICAMIVWACLTDDKRYLFVSLLFLFVGVVGFAVLLYRYVTEPKVAVQADVDGIYLCYRKGKEVFINYNDIVDIANVGIRNKYGILVIYTQTDNYKSNKTKELGDVLLRRVRQLIAAENKEDFLIKLQQNGIR